ncbi:DUF2809 domain-containing protein [Arcicella sp. LKC2W]|uniref:ribosomal maturation YjgA family protein n=1 Tax=Arcicella sp. LKC2W TaxID=2984198 RepID=UPI002B1F0B6C|nr:DUF2809 domain-containing protein [Arcicella sp. LKC2W]MEA5459005.1 DUF2809 domain-containing protein [Arcicella sp. LKC2W]
MKNRLIYLLCALFLIPIGLATRIYGTEFMKLYGGDALWAMMIYFGFRMLFPSKQSSAFWYALIFCYLIEISQLYHAEWIDAIRQNRLGGLILGFGFLWSDLVSYLVGILVGYYLDKVGQESFLSAY